MQHQKLKSIIRRLIKRSPHFSQKLVVYLNPFIKYIGMPMKYINNLQDLDIEIKKADKRALISDDELRKALSEFSYVIDQKLPRDPYSKEYYDIQMKLYSELSGKRQYSIENEHTDFDFERLKNNPFPYCTESPTTVGDQLIAQGFLIKTINLQPHSRIVEFGPGFGNTTLHFTQMGYKVTAVDCEQAFLDLIKYRVEKFENQVDLVKGDMVEFNPDRKYDAAIFFECFHHCSNHIKLLENLHKLISDRGLIAFAAEPITDFPYPWGLRLDGISVWSIRKFGWLELGFDTAYFLRTLLMLGWTPRRYRSDASPLADVIIARKSHRYYEPSEITLPPDEDKTWMPPDTNPENKLRFTRGKSVMTCAKTIDANAVEFCLSNYAPFALDVKLSAGSLSQTFKLPKASEKCTYTIPLRDWDGKVAIASKTWQPAKVLRNGDKRELGVAVHYFRFVD